MSKKNYMVKIIFVIVLIASSLLITGCSNNGTELLNVSNYDVNYTVLDESDVPIDGAVVTLDGTSKTTDSNGVVTFSKTDGTYDYNITLDGYETLSDVAVVSGDNISIEHTLTQLAPDEYNITFTVTDSSDTPIEGATVTLDSIDKTTNSNGIVTFIKPDGTYNYDVTATEYVDITNNSLTVSGADLTETVSMQDTPPAGYIGIYDWQDLDNIRNDMTADYILMNDLDSTTSGYANLASSSANEGKGWAPIGIPIDAFNLEGAFTGKLDGDNYTISDLEINRGTGGYIGLFGYIYEGTVQNLNLKTFNITGYSRVGSIAGVNDSGSIINSNLSGGSITGDTTAGGLVGHNFISSTISNCYSEATVQGINRIGGLVGYNESSIIEKSYAAGNVSGDTECGGLVGYNNNHSIIQNNYSLVDVTGNDNIGGLVGENSLESTITLSYSIGNVTGTGTGIGGLVGIDTGAYIASCYYDSQTAEQNDTGKGFPRTTKQMQEGTADTTIDGAEMYTSWDTAIWDFGSDTDYPSLSWE